MYTDTRYDWLTEAEDPFTWEWPPFIPKPTADEMAALRELAKEDAPQWQPWAMSTEEQKAAGL